MNPLHHHEMGSHPLPDDADEINAALLANQRCNTACPYFSLRYGERGVRFGASDSGYLITICHDGEEVLSKQVDWLCSVLASRGMPRLLMEKHLEILYHALAELKPDSVADYQPIINKANALRAQREALISPAQQQAIKDEFFSSVSLEEKKLLRQAPALVISACCDDALGLQDTLASLLDWLADQKQFSDAWVTAVRYCQSQAENLIKAAKHAQ